MAESVVDYCSDVRTTTPTNGCRSGLSTTETPSSLPGGRVIVISFSSVLKLWLSLMIYSTQQSGRVIIAHRRGLLWASDRKVPPCRRVSESPPLRYCAQTFPRIPYHHTRPMPPENTWFAGSIMHIRTLYVVLLCFMPSKHSYALTPETGLKSTNHK